MVHDILHAFDVCMSSLFRTIILTFRTGELVAIVATAIALLVMFLFFDAQVSLASALREMLRYFTFGNPQYVVFNVVVYGLALFEIARSMFRSRTHGSRTLFPVLLDAIRALAPFALVSVVFYALLVDMSHALGAQAEDALLASLDRALFGTDLFLAVPAFMTSTFWVLTFAIAYMSLTLVMNIFLVILFFTSRRSGSWDTFQQIIIAFILTLVIAFPISAAVPCQDPYHAFVASSEGKPSAGTPQSLARAISAQVGNAETGGTLERPGTLTPPITCMPSMHMAWGMFIVFLAFRLHPATLVLTIPWLLLMLTGGVLLGQHYVVDYLAAIPVGAAALFGGAWLVAYHARVRSKWRALHS